MNRHEAITQALAALNAIEPTATVPTLLDSIAGALSAHGTFTHGAKTSFAPNPYREDGTFAVMVERATHTEWGNPTTPAIFVELRVYGQMAYDSRVDSGAYVTVQLGGGLNDVYGHGHATAWNGRGYVELPEGARRAIAVAVCEVVGEHLDAVGIGLLQAVETIGRQHAEREYERVTAGLVGDALNALTKAVAR